MGSNISQNTDAQEVLDSLRRIVRVLREAAREGERKFGLSGAQVFVLHKLAEASPASLNELALRTHTHQSSVSTVVTRLVHQGLVRRVRSDRDARMVQLTLTLAGARLVKRTPDPPADRLFKAIESLPRSQQRALADALGSLAKAIGAAGKPLMFFEEVPPRKRR